MHSACKQGPADIHAWRGSCLDDAGVQAADKLTAARLPCSPAARRSRRVSETSSGRSPQPSMMEVFVTRAPARRASCMATPGASDLLCRARCLHKAADARSPDCNQQHATVHTWLLSAATSHERLYISSWLPRACRVEMLCAQFARLSLTTLCSLGTWQQNHQVSTESTPQGSIQLAHQDVCTWGGGQSAMHIQECPCIPSRRCEHTRPALTVPQSSHWPGPPGSQAQEPPPASAPTAHRSQFSSAAKAAFAHCARRQTPCQRNSCRCAQLVSVPDAAHCVYIIWGLSSWETLMAPSARAGSTSQIVQRQLQRSLHLRVLLELANGRGDVGSSTVWQVISVHTGQHHIVYAPLCHGLGCVLRLHTGRSAVSLCSTQAQVMMSRAWHSTEDQLNRSASIIVHHCPRETNSSQSC